MIFDPEQHEFSGEVRQPKMGEMYAGCGGLPPAVYVCDRSDCLSDLPIIVPRRRDLGWACCEMVRHPGKIYMRPGSDYLTRYTPGTGFEARVDDDGEDDCWFECSFDTEDENATDWMPLFHAVESASPAPGTLAWAMATVEKRGAVWITGFPLLKYDSEGFELDDETYKHPCTEWERENGWHLWGDRDWLAALPDGTRVVRDGERYTKHGRCLINRYGKACEITYYIDSGWDLDREQAEPCDLASQVAELERRVAKLEGKK